MGGDGDYERAASRDEDDGRRGRSGRARVRPTPDEEEAGRSRSRRQSRSRSPGRGDRDDRRSQHEARRARSPLKEESGTRGPTSGRHRDPEGQPREDRADRANGRLESRRSHHHHHHRRHSRSPSRSQSHSSHHSHHSSHHRHHHRRHRPSATSFPPEEALPFGARPLSRTDLAVFKPLFAYYLDLQKGIRLRDLDEHEVRGRWKSFVGKWNRHELAEGWYDPEMFQRVMEEHGAAPEDSEEGLETPPTSGGVALGPHEGGSGDEDNSDGGYGPSLPPGAAAAARRQGPGIPSLDDLELRREAAAEEQQARAEELRAARRLDRAEQKARLDEALPRAEPGTRERQLEKKKLLNEKLRGFRDRSPGGGPAEVAEGELMGGGDSLAEYRRAREGAQRRKSERELRREEMQRARAAEIEERLQRYREREEETVGMLRELAKSRFG